MGGELLNWLASSLGPPVKALGLLLELVTLNDNSDSVVMGLYPAIPYTA